MRDFIQDFSVILLLLVLSYFSFQNGLIALAVPLGVAGVTMMVLIVYVLLCLMKDSRSGD